MISKLDDNTLAFKSMGASYWRTLDRDSSLVLNEGDERKLFIILEGETIDSAIKRLSKLTEWPVSG